MSQEPQTSEFKEYEGTGRFVSTVGGWELGGLIGAIVGVVPAAVTTAVTGDIATGFGVGAVASLAGGAYGAVSAYNTADDGEKQFSRTQVELMETRQEMSRLREHAVQSHVERLGVRPQHRMAAAMPQQAVTDVPYAERVTVQGHQPHEHHVAQVIAQQQQPPSAVVR